MYCEAEADRLDAQTYLESIELNQAYEKVWKPRRQAIRDQYLIEEGEEVRFRLAKQAISPVELAWLVVDLSNALASEFPFDFQANRAEFMLLTRQAVIDAAVACAGYHNQNGRYPKRLAELVPDFLPETPKDPIDGKQLRYRTNNDGSAVVYSIYFDNEDDGGLTDPDDYEALEEGDYCYRLSAQKR
jgi:hypothetical protein